MGNVWARIHVMCVLIHLQYKLVMVEDKVNSKIEMIIKGL